MDSTKLLTEKLMLTRELSSLKPEVDHLRSQAASHQCLVAERLSLQRQLSMLQVEMENEKHLTGRTNARERKLREDDARLGAQMEKLRADLGNERRERLKAEEEAQVKSHEWEDKVVMLESRLDTFRSKLKASKDKLKEAQTKLHGAAALSNNSSNSSALSACVPNLRKRVASRIDEDTMIGTPGDPPAAKKSKRATAMIGEKSTFSITPFLNRTASVAPESPPSTAMGVKCPRVTKSSAPTRCKPNDLSAPVAGFARADEAPQNDGYEIAQSKKPGTLAPTKMARLNSETAPLRKSSAGTSLEQVAEEEIEQNVAKVPSNLVSNKDNLDQTIIRAFGSKKPRRKLLGGGLGGPLFDDDDGNTGRGNRSTSSVIRRCGALNSGGLGVPVLETCDPRGMTSAFGAISPLKKDKKQTFCS
ncbi:MAG: hypothetical protein Q9164_004635 [Protoblastenia rupestris]